MKINEPNELYGSFMQYLHISTESNNLQYLTNQIFKAAGKDIQMDVHNKKKGSMKYLDEFIDNYLDSLKVKEDAKILARDGLKVHLTRDYNRLKDVLKEVRVFGVGKTPTEKLKTGLVSIAKAMTPVVTACCIMGAAALTYFSFKDGMEAWGSLLEGNAMGFLVKSTISNLESDGAKSLGIIGGIAAHFGVKDSLELQKIRADMKGIIIPNSSNNLLDKSSKTPVNIKSSKLRFRS